MKQLFNWDVVTKPAYDSFGNEIQGYNRIVRNDTNATLNIAKKGYNAIPNEAFEECVRGFVDGLGCKLIKHGTYQKGKKLFAQVDHSEFASAIIENDSHGEIKNYATLVNSHDGSTAFKIFITSVRMFCMNQYHAIRRRGDVKNGVSIKHTTNYDVRLNDFINSMDDIIVAQKDIVNRMNEMANTSSFDNITEYAIELNKLEEKPRPINRKNERTGAFERIGWTPPQFSTRGVNIIKNYESIWDSYSKEMSYSDWGLFNTTTHYVDHELDMSGGNGYGLFGRGLELKSRAFNLLQA